MSGVVCPRCGGSSHTAIAANLYECTTLVAESESVRVLDQNIVLGPNAYGMRWEIVTVERPCGHEFQSGTVPGAPACNCGLFAVGLCSACKKPVCGVHSTHQGSLRCGECADQFQRERDQRQSEIELEQQARASARAAAALDAAAAAGEPIDLREAADAVVARALSDLAEINWRGTDHFEVRAGFRKRSEPRIFVGTVPAGNVHDPERGWVPATAGRWVTPTGRLVDRADNPVDDMDPVLVALKVYGAAAQFSRTQKIPEVLLQHPLGEGFSRYRGAIKRD